MIRGAIVLVPLAVLAASLPFETLEGLPLPGGLMLTNVEAALAAYLLLSWSARGLRPRWTRPSSEAWAVLLWLALLAASALASGSPGSGLKFAARLALGPLVFWTAGRDLGLPRGRQIAVGSVLFGAALAATAGLVETYRIADLSPALAPFRRYITTDQGVLRLTGPFQHANLAAGALDLLLPIALALAAIEVLGPRRAAWPSALRLASYPLLCWALVATISRAGVAAGAIGVSVATLALVGILPRRLGLRVAAVSAAGFALAALLSSGIATAIRARVFGLPPNLHGVAYAVEPSAIAPAGATVELPVVLRNTGFLTWRHRPPNPFQLAYHWVDSEGRTIVFEGARTPLPHDVASGDEVALRATVWTPGEAGEYLLLWDLVHERVTWFSQRGSPAARTYVHVVEEASAQPASPSEAPSWTQSVATEMDPWVENEMVPRRKLWSIALSQTAAHPLLGIGPGRFGVTYAADLAPGRYDPGLSAHNLYLELASTTGIPGLGAFLTLMAALAREFLSTLRRASLVAPADAVWAAAGLGVLGAFLAHGFLDCFLASHAVSLTFWIALSVCRPWSR